MRLLTVLLPVGTATVLTICDLGVVWPRATESQAPTLETVSIELSAAPSSLGRVRLRVPFARGCHPQICTPKQDWQLLTLDLPSVADPDASDIFDLRHKEGPARRGVLVAVGRFGGFTAGWWAAALAHELGHALIAWGYGYKFIWPTSKANSELFLPYWSVSPTNLAEYPSRRRNIASGGFLMSAAVSETLLGFNAFPKSDTFVGGFLFYDLLNAVVYIFRDIYEANRNNLGVGDIRDMHAGGIPRELIYGILLARSAITLVRVLDDPDFVRLRYWWSTADPR